MDPASGALHLLAAKYFQIASYTMFVYDLIITFGQEVERIWTRPISVASVLFFINRYGTLAWFTIIVVGKSFNYLAVACTHAPVAFHDPDWKGESYVPLTIHCTIIHQREVCRCARFAPLEGLFALALLAAGQIIMILRVVAMYKGSKRIFAFLLVIWAGEVIISVIGLRKGFAAHLPPGLVGCILTGSPSNILFPSIWITPLITDSFIFLLTIYCTRRKIRLLFTPFTSGQASVTDRAITILIRDGVMYYFLIFLVNLMNVLIYSLAPPDIKPIGASFGRLLACAMVSRLVLNLRSLSSGNQDNAHMPRNMLAERWPPNGLNAPGTRQLESIWTRTLNEFTEDDIPPHAVESEHATSGEIPLRLVKITHYENDHSHHEV